MSARILMIIIYIEMRMNNILIVAFFTWYLIAGVSSTIVNFDKEFYSQSFTDFDFTSWTIGGTPAPTENLATACNGDRLFGGRGCFYIRLQSIHG